jgi:WD40 repeat protein
MLIQVHYKSAPLHTLKDTNDVNSVAIASDNTKIVSGSNDTTVKIWDQTNCSHILVCKFDSSVTAINLSNNNKNIEVGDANGNSIEWK